MSATLIGLGGALKAIDTFVDDVEKRRRVALDYACRELVNYAKEHAPFRDRTGNLRRSIGHRVVDHYEGMTGPVGLFYASAEYAVHIEFKSGYWVLSGAVTGLAGTPTLDGIVVGALQRPGGPR